MVLRATVLAETTALEARIRLDTLACSFAARTEEAADHYPIHERTQPVLAVRDTVDKAWRKWFSRRC